MHDENPEHTAARLDYGPRAYMSALADQPATMAMYDAEVQRMASELRGRYLTHDQLLTVLRADRRLLSDLASEANGGLHRWVRNWFGLWTDEAPTTRAWREAGPLLIDGVDHHPLHPDQVSAAVVEALWYDLQVNPPTRPHRNALLEVLAGVAAAALGLAVAGVVLATAIFALWVLCAILGSAGGFLAGVGYFVLLVIGAFVVLKGITCQVIVGACVAGAALSAGLPWWAGVGSFALVAGPWGLYLGWLWWALFTGVRTLASYARGHA